MSEIKLDVYTVYPSLAKYRTWHLSSIRLTYNVFYPLRFWINTRVSALVNSTVSEMYSGIYVKPALTDNQIDRYTSDFLKLFTFNKEQ